MAPATSDCADSPITSRGQTSHMASTGVEQPLADSLYSSSRLQQQKKIPACRDGVPSRTFFTSH
eukprot:m.481017 g.481017  ORF g.481017 m.481017 type:complete len:64 (+) comp55086_c0_seq1:208-399(+)